MKTLLTAAAVGLVSSMAVGQTPGFYLLGYPGSSTLGGSARALSQDGSVAVGLNVTPERVAAFRWTAAGGRDDFGLQPGMPLSTWAFGISGDASTIVGWSSTTPTGAEAFRRVGNGPVESLGILPNHDRSRALGVSGDGRIVVGQCETGVGCGYMYGEAFRWTAETGMQSIGHLRPEGTKTRALAISRDGTTIVGASQSFGSGGPTEAFSWTESGGFTALPRLPGASSTAWSQANAVNVDGSVIVGQADNAQGLTRAVRWTALGIEDLGTLPGSPSSIAYALSDDGMVVGGTAPIAIAQNAAMVWTPSTGMVALSDYLASFGITVPSEWRLTEVYAISGDGLTFAGRARSLSGETQGFVATVPAPAGLVVLAPLLVFGRRRRAAC